MSLVLYLVCLITMLPRVCFGRNVIDYIFFAALFCYIIISLLEYAQKSFKICKLIKTAISLFGFGYSVYLFNSTTFNTVLNLCIVAFWGFTLIYTLLTEYEGKISDWLYVVKMVQ